MVDSINVSFTRGELFALKRLVSTIVDDHTSLQTTDAERRAGVLAALKVHRAYGELVGVAPFELTLGGTACDVVLAAVFPPPAKKEKPPAPKRILEGRSRSKVRKAKRAAAERPPTILERMVDEHGVDVDVTRAPAEAGV